MNTKQQFRRRLSIGVAIGVAFLGSAVTRAASDFPFQDESLELEERVEDLLSRLSLEEKAKLCHGWVSPERSERFLSGGVERLGIAPLSKLDGPVGVRLFDKDKTATAMPSTLMLANTWDLDAANRYGSLIAREMLAYGRNVLFGPGINLMRSPLGGRNFEYMGEDPLLAGSLGVSYINAVQELGVAACAKHYLANDIDHMRHFTSSNMDDRTMRELHLLPFEMAVEEANVWTIMSGNNLFRGIHVAENPTVTKGILKDEYDWDGVMLTDWRAAYNTIPAALAGTDMTTGLCAYVYGDERLLNAVRNHSIPEELLDEMARRVLRLYFRSGVLGTRVDGEVNSVRHREEARALAGEGIVLLKNEGSVLPLSFEGRGKVLVAGPGSEALPSGSGSSRVRSSISSTPLDGLLNALGEERISYFDSDSGFDVVVEAAQNSELIVYFAEGHPSGESKDMKDLILPGNQSAEIRALSESGTPVVVVLFTPSVVDMSRWIDGIAGCVVVNYGGQSTGDAVADVLTGKVNPGGKLSYTIAKSLDDYAPHSLGAWPQKARIENAPTKSGRLPDDRYVLHAYDIDYEEGLLLGYRWFASKGVEPLFPFGFGLSYTQFSIENEGVEMVSDTTTEPFVRVRARITNTGKVAGSEVVQLYVRDEESSVERPERELKAFEKVRLEPGESISVVFELSQRSFAFWDTLTDSWVVEPGDFSIIVGNSSEDSDIVKEVSLN